VRILQGVSRLTLPQPYEELDHTADVGVVVRGDSAEQTLSRLVLALGALLSGGGAVTEQRELVVRVGPGEHSEMAVDVLRELLFRFDSEHVVASSCETRWLDPERGAELRVGVGAYDEIAHAEGIELKAVTLHAARFEPRDGGWTAQIVFDI
jgi:SHS2 domain-containing protein